MASRTVACRSGPSWAYRWQLVLGVCVASASLLRPVDTEAPDGQVFPYASGIYIQPAHTEVAGPKGTNKFWANWVVSSGAHEAIIPGPYSLRWASTAAGSPPDLLVSNGEVTSVYGGVQTTGADRVEWYTTPFVGEFGLGAVESSGGQGHVIVHEGLFGVWAAWRGPAGTSRQVTYPVFSGMTYVSALFEGGFTPRITSQRAITTVHKIGDGVWRFVNSVGVEFRVYALTSAGEPVDGSFDFDAAGQLNGPLEGWIRLARVVEQGDEAVLDAHARAVLTGVDLEVAAGGIVRYVFEKSGHSSTPLLHFAYRHHRALFAGVDQTEAVGLAPVRSPTKGHMQGVLGDAWNLSVDLSEVSDLGFLLGGEPEGSLVPLLAQEALGTLQWFLENGNWKTAMFKTSYYFSGKGFQKVAMVCLLVEKFHGAGDGQTQSCAGILEAGFRCLYDPAYSGDCAGAPGGAYYDQDWGGIPSRAGYDSEGCMGWADFGNACYNDHHYHYGYYVVAAAVLVKLVPSLAADAAFVTYVEMLIRDTTNPSPLDLYFPLFRSFDWFDLHSWSRGVTPSADGKDQESTSEELNLLYGIHLWGTVMGKPALRDLGQTMLALCAVTVREFFLLEVGNPNHPEDFVKNHVTGIFFQNRVHYTTWFGWDKKFIHGIQMLPLSPALQLTRRREFCQQEWDDIISGLPLSATDPWTSILLTGTLACIDPADAFTRLVAMEPAHMDDGLTRAWALYWAASLSGDCAGPPTGITVVTSATTTPSPTPSAAVPTPAPAPSPAPTEQPTSSVSLCGHAATQCSSSQAIQAYFDKGCLSGGLGCNAFGLTCCRFCGAGSYTSISCPGSVTPSPAPELSPAPVPTEQPTSSVGLCGHAATQCSSSWATQAYFDEGCLHGGLGCNAFGLTCCRFCGAGSYASISCPSSATPAPFEQPATAYPTPTPTHPPFAPTGTSATTRSSTSETSSATVFSLSVSSTSRSSTSATGTTVTTSLWSSASAHITTATSTSTTQTTSTTLLYVVIGSMLLESSGTQDEVADAANYHLSIYYGMDEDQLSVYVAYSSARSVSNAWDIGFEIVASIAFARQILDMTNHIVSDSSNFTASLQTSFRSRGVEIVESSLEVAPPEIRILTAAATTERATLTSAAATSTVASSNIALTGSTAATATSTATATTASELSLAARRPAWWFVLITASGLLGARARLGDRL